ncbi:MAG: DUF1254 domain-containing protein, partial [Cyclobacteriaceae bacterium]|nr:DUF1254 domain-containing protein [Cyclobacteriaceae bacterium]
MKTIKFTAVILSLLVLSCQPAKDKKETSNEITQELVEDAYIYGLGIVSMYRYYKKMRPNGRGLNEMIHNRAFFEPGILSGGPNRDGLYSFGWFDLNDEPIVVSLPDFDDRYFVWQMTSMYCHNFHNVGSYLREGPVEKYRAGYTFAMVGPDWQGEAPEGVEIVTCPVNVVNVLYRIAAKGQQEYPEGIRLQDATFTLPLSEWVKGTRETVVKPPSNPIPEFREVLTFKPGVKGKDQRNPIFFSVLADAIAANKPYAEWDKKFISNQLAKLGVTPGIPFDFESLEKEFQDIILDAQESAFDQVIARGDTAFGVKMNGWFLNPANHGDWKEDFWNRSYATYTGGMYPTSNNSTYATTYYDANDIRIDGKGVYRLRFEKDNYPPATYFWSVTAYDAG